MSNTSEIIDQIAQHVDEAIVGHPTLIHVVKKRAPAIAKYQMEADPARLRMALEHTLDVLPHRRQFSHASAHEDALGPASIGATLVAATRDACGPEAKIHDALERTPMFRRVIKFVFECFVWHLLMTGKKTGAEFDGQIIALRRYIHAYIEILDLRARGVKVIPFELASLDEIHPLDGEDVGELWFGIMVALGENRSVLELQMASVAPARRARVETDIKRRLGAEPRAPMPERFAEIVREAVRDATGGGTSPASN